MTYPIDRPDNRTLILKRIIDAPRAAVWRCWSEPDLLKEWYCPKPWRVSEADIDLQPGGRMTVVMEGPEGERIDCPGILLEVIPGRRLTFTDAYREGFVPAPDPFMTGFVELEAVGDGRTSLTWGARHATPEAAERHLEMGFEAGWSAASDQLQDLAASRPVAKGADLVFAAKVRTCLFLKDAALEAAETYTALLADSAIDAVHRPDPDGPPLVVEFTLAGAPYMALNGCPDVQPSAAMSISVLTEDQEETDRLWDALCAEGGEAGSCGWLKDRFGVHWQIVPKALPRLMQGGDRAAAARVSEALMAMGRIQVAALEAAFDTRPTEGTA